MIGERPLNWLFNVCTGRMWHWNRAHNETVKLMWNQTAPFPPTFRLFFQSCLTSSMVVVTRLVGPIGGKERILSLNVKQVSERKFRDVHAVLVWGFAAQFGYLNPQFREPYLAATADFVGRNERTERVVHRILSMEPFNALAFSDSMWDEVLEILESSQADTFLNRLSFMNVVAAASIVHSRGYREEMLRLG